MSLEKRSWSHLYTAHWDLSRHQYVATWKGSASEVMAPSQVVHLVVPSGASRATKLAKWLQEPSWNLARTIDLYKRFR